MFTKEYLNQKLLLTFIIGILICFSFHFLQKKEGISYEEANTYAIANSNHQIATSPYGKYTLNQTVANTDFIYAPYFTILKNVFQYSIDTFQEKTDNSSVFLQEKQSDFSNPTWRNKSYYNNLLSVNEASGFHYNEVTYKCMTNQKPPLYYWILHTLSSLLPMYTLNFLGFWINIIFALGSCYFIYHICRNFFDSGFIGLAACILFGFSIGGLTGILCTQPYMMLIFFLLMSIYLHLTFIEKDQISIGSFQLLLLTNILGFFTDYLFLAFSIFTSVLYLIVLLGYKRIRDFFQYLLLILLSVCICFFTYPISLLHIALKTNSTIHLFQLDKFGQQLLENILFLKEQLFIKGSFFIGFVLIIIMLASLLFKKAVIHNRWDNLKQKLYNMEIQDTFLFMLTITYFLCISLLLPTNNLKYLIVTFPAFCILFSIFTYRLCHSITTSAVNSGMITICFAVLICFFGLLNNTPSFLYSGYTEKINFANTYCTDACIFVNSDTNEAGSHILELEQFNCSLILDTNHLNFVKDDPIVQNNNELLVYISFQEKIDGVIEKLAKKANYSFSKELCRFKDQNLDETYIYKLSR